MGRLALLLIVTFFFVAANLYHSQKAIQPHLLYKLDPSTQRPRAQNGSSKALGDRNEANKSTVRVMARDNALVPISIINSKTSLDEAFERTVPTQFKSNYTKATEAKGPANKAYEVCFVSCLFGTSSNATDRLQNITGMQARNPSFRFYVYTNLPDLVAPGWTLLVRQYPYKRLITHSRWGKFMSWRDEIIVKKCRAVIYLDGIVVLKEGTKAAAAYRDIALSVQRSEFGLAQRLHRGGGGILREFVRIRRGRKDIPSNIAKSLEWLSAQPGFERKIPMYENTYFAFDPTNPRYQEVSSYFWSRYSLELDSWRDQPLWAHSIHKFNVTPILFGQRQRMLFKRDGMREGFGGHRYTSEADVDGSQALARDRKIASNTTADRSYEACFITSVFGSTKDKNDIDQPPDIRTLKEENPTFRYFAYTNLNDTDAPGWTLVVKHLPYKRYVTQSRWAKFMAWQDAEVKMCNAVFYMDGYIKPRARATNMFRKLAESIRKSRFGLAQVPHPEGGGIEMEFRRILKQHKDSPANIEALRKWLKAQPDYNSNCTMYENTFFGYDPSNLIFRNASSFFWNHYSLEKDSWRDQPLWCYVLDKFEVTPLRELYGPLFEKHMKRFGSQGH